MDDYITTLEAAEILNIAQQSVARHCRKGTFASAKQMGKTWVISKREIEDYARSIRGLPKTSKRRGSSLE